jgi:hypothetical protein
MQGIDEPTTSASPSRTKAASMSDTERHENTPLLQIKKGGARFEHAGINDNDRPYINDVTDGMSSPLFKKRGCVRRLPYPVIMVICAMMFFGLLAIGYTVSPPQSRWDAHIKDCPAQKEYCQLLGDLSIEIQFALACTIFTVLTTTWWTEKPRRPLIRFIADNSKSVMLAVMTHFLAGMSAVMIKRIVKHDNVLDCDWYFVIFIWDSLIGVSATIAIHQWSATKFQTWENLEVLSRIGDYEARPHPITGYRELSTNVDRFRRWGYQMAHWISCAIVARLFDFGLLFLVAEYLAGVAAGIGWWACTSAQVKAKQWLNILAMPMVLDSCQFVIQNHFLKAKKTEFHDGVTPMMSRSHSRANSLDTNLILTT